MRHLLYFLSLALLAGCADMGPSISSPNENESPLRLPPLASAGADREILWGYPNRLMGGGTTHPMGKRFDVHWEQLTGDPVELSNAAALSPTFLAPLDEQDLIFELVADDGTWRTTDEVRLVVTRSPSARAPRLRAGPDRHIDFNATAAVEPEDVATMVPDTVSVTWEAIVPEVSPQILVGAPASDLGATLFRLTGEREGLRSAVDYLLLYPFDDEQIGETAPLCNIEAPEMIGPGESFVLDATGSSDSNGDEITFRWEQTHGPSLLTGDEWKNTVRIESPLCAEELVFRAYAQDALLESAPAEVSIVVAPRHVTTPEVAPKYETRTHPGNNVWIDALARDPMAGAGYVFDWSQTRGLPLEPELLEGGRFLRFAAPVEPAELAFAVIARLPDNGATIESAPAVSRVSVVSAFDNLSPEIYLCASSLNPTTDAEVVVTARIADPEADTLATVVWSSETDKVEVNVVLVEIPPESINETDLCGFERTPTELVAGTALVATYQVELTTPEVEATITIELEVCDDLGACGEGEIEIVAAEHP